MTRLEQGLSVTKDGKKYTKRGDEIWTGQLIIPVDQFIDHYAGDEFDDTNCPDQPQITTAQK